MALVKTAFSRLARPAVCTTTQVRSYADKAPEMAFTFAAPSNVSFFLLQGF